MILAVCLNLPSLDKTLNDRSITPKMILALLLAPFQVYMTLNALNIVPSISFSSPSPGIYDSKQP